MRRFVFGFVLLGSALVAAPGWAQNPLVGTWEIVSQTRDGQQAPQVDYKQRAVYFFVPDGHWAWVALPPERPNMNKRAQDMTKDELFAQYRGVFAGWGTYAVSGDKLTEKIVSSVTAPSGGQPDNVMVFKVDGDELVLTSPPSDEHKQVVRFRRLK